jgi:hypothetical protein
MTSKIVSGLMALVSTSAFADSPLFNSVARANMKISVTSPMNVDGQFYANGRVTTALGEGVDVVTCYITGTSSDYKTLNPGTYDVYAKSGFEIPEASDTQLILNAEILDGYQAQVRMDCEHYGRSGEAVSKNLTIDQIEKAIGSWKFIIN